MTNKMRPQVSADFYQLLFNNIPTGLAHCQMVFQHDHPEDFIFIEINNAFLTLTGLKDVVGKKATEVIPEIKESSLELFEICGRVAQTGVSEQIEIYIPQLYRWFFIFVSSFEKGRFLIIFYDISDRKRIEKNLEEAKIAARNVFEDLGVEKDRADHVSAKYDATLASIGDGILVTDMGGRIIRMNRAAEIILGREEGDFLGKELHGALNLYDKKGVLVPQRERPSGMVLKTGKATSIKEDVVYYSETKEGVKFPVTITAAPIILNGGIIGVVEIFRDITKERELDKAKDEFISLAAHQLRSPITSIAWNLEMLLSGDGGVLDKKQKEVLEGIYKSSTHLSELVTGFLDVTKLESSNSVIERGEVDLLKVSDSTLEELAPRIGDKKITITKKYDVGIPHLMIGLKTAEVIFQNLFTNAIKYTPEGGVVEIGILKKAEMVSISVKDNGYGIPEDAKGEIFTKLFRADNIKEKEPSGTGLGLYLVKVLVGRVGGRIWFESKEGVGSTFYVDLKIEDR